MNEPVTIVKVRKETKVTIPAGGWMLLVGPDQHFAAHAEKRAKLIKPDLVNEDFESVCVGRIRNTHQTLRLITSAQKKASDDELAKSAEAFKKSNADAENRTKALKASEDKKLSEDHSEKISKINKENDAIREKSAAAA